MLSNDKVILKVNLSYSRWYAVVVRADTHVINANQILDVVDVVWTELTTIKNEIFINKLYI